MGLNEKGGSFGIPQDVLEAVEASKKKGRGDTSKDSPQNPDPQAPYDSESIPELEESGPENEDEKVPEKGESPEAQIKNLEKELGSTLDEDDLWTVATGNTLLKRNITIIPGKLVATFKTLSTDESELIAEKFKECVDKGMLDHQIGSKNTRELLSHGIVELGKPGKAKAFEDSYESRHNQLGKMNSFLLQKLALKWNQFNLLVQLVLNKEMDEGNS